MAVHMGMAAGEFKQRYCTTSGGRMIIKQRSDGYCILWDQGCTVHAVKPRMCRAWPFIENLLRDIENWRIMAANCPGIRMDAAPEAIRACVRQTLAAHPSP
jgi:Fe-S-cluster containining protein